MGARTMSNTRSLALAVAALAALVVGCNKTSSNFCCLSADTCEDFGVGITTCDDPARPVCDEAGEHGPAHGCIPDPSASDCDGPEDCTSERPFCIDGTCRQCETSDDCEAAAPVCGDAYLCEACTLDDDCAGRADTPRCDVDDGACVACLDADDCGSPTAPVCDVAEHTCRGCEAHDECASDVCDLDTGTCVAAADAIYVSTTGQAAGTCTQATPCNSFALGIAQVTVARSIIKAAPGTYSGQIVIDDLTVSIFADGAIVEPPATNQSVIVVTNGADVTIDGITARGAGGVGNPVGVQCSTGAGSPPVLRLRRSTISGNSGGGVSISSCTFSLVNNWIAGNGNPNGSFGGVSLASIGNGLREIEFNTIYNNDAQDVFAAGVACSGVTAAVVISNSIVYGNQSTDQIDGPNCSVTYSNVGPSPIAGTGNINMAPVFVDAGNGDFHLQATSPGVDAADPAATLAVDIDGDTRPQGGGRDMGADEVVR